MADNLQLLDRLLKLSDVSQPAYALESPLELVLSEVDNPYNCKVKVTPSLNVSALKDGSYYSYLLALKPAGYTSRGTVLVIGMAILKQFLLRLTLPISRLMVLPYLVC
ncbi:hypothetical protein [Kamptonema sp. UHCC 0994]|uniref:hypothetical protein n=1 Tax=Kamptonema sp. UHCC 0994 TaxID=3031329 RepID=UPI0023BAC482|nr:hypothetical protein [Kamptonema sp. UHCC 0994]MDF0556673.1 hypothetical protein [Kamptonema sp. UHCC 0994]